MKYFILEKSKRTVSLIIRYVRSSVENLCHTSLFPNKYLKAYYNYSNAMHFVFSIMDFIETWTFPMIKKFHNEVSLTYINIWLLICKRMWQRFIKFTNHEKDIHDPIIIAKLSFQNCTKNKMVMIQFMIFRLIDFGLLVISSGKSYED